MYRQKKSEIHHTQMLITSKLKIGFQGIFFKIFSIFSFFTFKIILKKPLRGQRRLTAKVILFFSVFHLIGQLNYCRLTQITAKYRFDGDIKNGTKKADTKAKSI